MTEAADSEDPWVVIESLAAGALLLVMATATPYVAAFLHSRKLPDISVVESAVGFARVITGGHVADPAAVFPEQVARLMPGAAGWWGAAAWTVGMTIAFAIGAWKRIDALLAAATAGRRPYQVRGSRTRTWARPRDLAGAVDHCRRRDRFTLGRLDGRFVLSGPESHVALVAPTRSGKTTRFVIPWLLEHKGPAIVTSTKRDVVEAASEAGCRRGRVWVWDPFGGGDARWNPLRGCQDWGHALAQAQWLADSSGEGESEIAAYWRGEAAKLLAPLLHAAALDAGSMDRVLGWVDAQNAAEPTKILTDAKHDAAVAQLAGVSELDPRNRGTTYMSAGSLLAAYRYPVVSRPGVDEFVVSDFLDSGCETLFIVAGARHQRLLAPLVVGLLSSVFHEAAERARQGPAARPTVRVLLDEAANIAPVRDLPAHLSQAGGHGVRMATVWQSLAQLHDRYRTAADSILANSTSKVFLGPITDEQTRRYVQGLLGSVPVETHTRTQGGFAGGAGGQRTTATAMRSALGAAELQQLEMDRALVVEGTRKPALVRTRPWWSEDGWRS